MSADRFVEAWRSLIVGSDKSWVVFEHGTCVVLVEPEDDLEKQAKAVLADYGPVHAGSAFGDFDAFEATDYPAWIVTGHHPDILNLVFKDNPDLVAKSESSGPANLLPGLIGRGARGDDAESLNVIHVEDNR